MESTAARRYEDENFVDTSKKVWNYSVLSDQDISNFQNGTHYRLYEKFGSHSMEVNQQWGVYFAVWAPNATSVSVKGNFNDWKNDEYELYARWDKSGVWEGFIPSFTLGEVYKYHIIGYMGVETDKGDPFANMGGRIMTTSLALLTLEVYYRHPPLFRRESSTAATLRHAGRRQASRRWRHSNRRPRCLSRWLRH